jgi:S-adenosylmethionine hydrolase
MGILTLITDFGIKDGNVGVMKGVIWGIAPEVNIVDLSHTIQPQNVEEASLVLLRAVPYFPDGTVHVVVVDPGVGTARRPIAAQVGTQRFVLPDNGVLSRVLDRADKLNLAVELVHLTDPSYWLSEVSHVFHGRDIFAPVGAYLAQGVSMAQMGKPIEDPVRFTIPIPQSISHGLRGEIIHIDHFGNISTSIYQEHLGQPEEVTTHIKGVEIFGMVKTFGEKPAGELVALYGSTGNFIICVVNGNAAERLGAQVGDVVDVVWSDTKAG